MISQSDYTRILGIRRRNYSFMDVSLQGRSFVTANVAKVLGVVGGVAVLGWAWGISILPSWLSFFYYLLLPMALLFLIFRTIADDMKVHEWLGVLLAHLFVPKRGYGFGCRRQESNGVLTALVWNREGDNA